MGADDLGFYLERARMRAGRADHGGAADLPAVNRPSVGTRSGERAGRLRATGVGVPAPAERTSVDRLRSSVMYDNSTIRPAASRIATPGGPTSSRRGEFAALVAARVVRTAP